MTDITTKLRSGNYGWLSQDLNAEAADEIDRLRAANRHLIDMHDAVIDDARKYSAAQVEIARLREVLIVIAYPLNIGKIYHMDAVTQARAALAQVAEVGK